MQANVYLFQGQHKGLSPREYLDRIKDYSLEHKHVNWIKVHNHLFFCFFFNELYKLKTIIVGLNT